jgi:hypothetical protein
MTPFINAIGSPIGPDGGINNATARVVNSFEYPIAVPFDTGQGSQPAITEAGSVTGVAATTVTRGQDTNTCQIFLRKAEVSYKKLSTPGTHGIVLEGSHNIDGAASGVNIGATSNQVQNELDFQITANMKGIASDLDYSVIQGTYQGAASASTAAKMRGLKNAISTNAVAAGSAALTTTHINSCLKAMVDSGAPLNRIVALCNSFQRQAIGALYEFVPQSRTEGGAQIQSVYTDFCIFDLLYDPNMPTDSIYFVEMTVCRLVVCPISGRVMLVEDKSTDGASYAKQMYLQAGFDYGPEEYHGKISGLSTS